VRFASNRIESSAGFARQLSKIGRTRSIACALRDPRSLASFARPRIGSGTNVPSDRTRYPPLLADRDDRPNEVLIQPPASRDAVHDDADPHDEPRVASRATATLRSARSDDESQKSPWCSCRTASCIRTDTTQGATASEDPISVSAAPQPIVASSTRTPTQLDRNQRDDHVLASRPGGRDDTQTIDSRRGSPSAERQRDLGRRKQVVNSSIRTSSRSDPRATRLPDGKRLEARKSDDDMRRPGL